VNRIVDTGVGGESIYRKITNEATEESNRSTISPTKDTGSGQHHGIMHEGIPGIISPLCAGLGFGDLGIFAPRD